MKNKTINAFIGRETEFEGKLNFDGTIRIDGHLKGEIIGNGGQLIVGEEGLIEADIQISNIITSGEIHGNIIADHKIEILPPGKVLANIQTPILAIHNGAIFEGKVQMPRLGLVGDEGLESIITERHNSVSPKPSGTIYGVVTGDLPRSHDSIHDIVKAVEGEKTIGPLAGVTVSAKCKGIGKRKAKTNDSGYYKLAQLRQFPMIFRKIWEFSGY